MRDERSAALCGAAGPCAALRRAVPSICESCDIRQLSFCAGLDDVHMHGLERIRATVTLSAGDNLFMEGDAATTVYNLTDGALRVFKLLPDGRRQITGFALPGDFVGLSAAGAYAYGAEAISDAQLCRFARPQLDTLFRNHPELERRLLAITGDALVAAQEHMLLLGRMTPVEKVAAFLLRLAERAGRLGRASDPLILPMSRGDIADFLGLTVETVSRTFTRLRTEGVIALPQPDEVHIGDLDELRELVPS